MVTQSTTSWVPVDVQRCVKCPFQHVLLDLAAAGCRNVTIEPRCSRSSCVDINECLIQANVASCEHLGHGSHCVNSIGSWACSNCTAGSEWNSLNQSCGLIACEPYRVPHSDSTCTGMFGDECQFHCQPGATIAGSASGSPTGVTACRADGRFDRNMFCTRTACRHGVLLNSNHATVPTACEGSTGDMCQYTCNDGYVSSGVPYTCAASGVWTGGEVRPTSS